MHIPEPFLRKSFQILHRVSRTVKVQRIQHNTLIGAVHPAQKLRRCVQILHPGPGDKFQVYAQVILRSQIAEAAEGILIEHCILRPDIRKNMMNPKLRCGFQIFFIILHVHTVKDSGIFRIMNLDALCFCRPPRLPQQCRIFRKSKWHLSGNIFSNGFLLTVHSRRNTAQAHAVKPRLRRQPDKIRRRTVRGS